MKVFLLILLLLLGFPASADQKEVANDLAIPRSPGTRSEQAAAAHAANLFLAAADRDRLVEIWPKLSILLRATGDHPGWEAMFKHLHRDIGHAKSRRLAKMGFTDQIGDKLPGRYCIILFESDYERAIVAEKIAVSLEDGTWKVAGYIFNFKRKR